MTEAEVESIVKKTLQVLGINTDSWEEVQADFAHLRRSRLAAERVSAIVIRAVILALVGGVVGLILLGVNVYITGDTSQ